ncbi:MAG: AAA family ATPase [Burkholderiaceae bacterium]|jgi:exonuclease SbcC|nr:AAA family ATPase [Burkholderiaceae bacterium]
MRILQIRFLNLNSLVGEWEIDLAHPAFAADGIFAITGPTGAGKTTILDAICLALYGRTPRLNRIGKNTNEIMSRQSGECFAEVTFETQAGRFRCHWSQHRARKRPGGEFQPPQHEIANAITGGIFETKIRGVAEQIEAATGMDFGRFTRSMLLAQGDFAAFLQASPDERAPILEQITGTAIYSHISCHVHARLLQERKKQEALQTALGGLQTLTPEAEQQLERDLNGQEAQETALVQQLTQKEQAITWLTGIARLEDELKKLWQEKKVWQERFDAFAPEQERLQQANRALELSADNAALTTLRAERLKEESRRDICQKALPDSIAATEKTESATRVAAEQLAAKKAEQNTLLPNIRQAQALDTEIAGKDAAIKAAHDMLAKQVSAHDALTRQQTAADLAEKRKARDAVQTQLAENPADGKLVEHLAGLQNRFEAWVTHAKQLLKKQEEMAQAKRQYEEAHRDWQKQATLQEEAQRILQKARDALLEKETLLSKTLDGRDIALWRKQQSALTAQKNCIDEAQEALRSLAKWQESLVRHKDRQEALWQDESKREHTLTTEIQKQAQLEKEVNALEIQLTLLKRIEALEKSRSQLQDGEPCPLCGATVHPFAEGNIPVPDETQKQLAAARTQLKSLTGDISALRVRQASAQKDREQVIATQKELADNIHDIHQTIHGHCATLGIIPSLSAADPALAQALEQLRVANENQLAHAARVVDTADATEKELVTRRHAQANAHDANAKQTLATQNSAHNKESAAQTVKRLEKEAAAHQKQGEEARHALYNEVKAYGTGAFTEKNADTVYAQLRTRRDQWVFRTRKKEELEKEIAVLEARANLESAQLREAKVDIQKQQAVLDTLLREQGFLRDRRRECLGDKKTGAEEKRLADAIESAHTVLEDARQKSSLAAQARDQLKTTLLDLEAAIHNRAAQLQSADTAFQARLKAAGFPGEESYIAACLPEDTRKLLAQSAQKLSDEKNEIAAAERDKTRTLEAEREKGITTEPLTTLQHAVAVLKENQRKLRQEIGANRQKREDNAYRKQQQQQQIQAIDAQKREYTRWDRLHNLIGSADGKKYRNFAQGLTFETMIGHANRQLQKMTDRYLLTRDTTQPLELNIIDHYQAGEIRSTKNLSGGESFIVSLSLALGLSHMASKNVRVDSLFLDEGFGTLDEEALDIALETLASLRQNGKLIGIISHVPALKERIGTQIQLIPQTEGRSRIEGPGCRRHPDREKASRSTAHAKMRER